MNQDFGGTYRLHIQGRRTSRPGKLGQRGVRKRSSERANGRRKLLKGRNLTFEEGKEVRKECSEEEKKPEKNLYLLLPRGNIFILKMEAVGSSEMLVHIYQTTERHMLEDSNLHIRRRENLKSHTPKEIVIVMSRNRFSSENEA
jgi:hypothetical protein